MKEVITSAQSDSDKKAVWFLAGQVSAEETVRHIPIYTSPFQIGRRGDLALCINHATVSSCHAEITINGDAPILRDLNSTNGTYVNGGRLTGSTTLAEDDLIQFADIPFRVRKQSAMLRRSTVAHEEVCDMALALVQFDKLMSQRSVTPFFQPIVSLDDFKPMGFEVLARSQLMGLEMPAAMFRAASQLDLEVELSRMFRWEGISNSAMLPKPFTLFVNTHPLELKDPGLLASMEAVRNFNPSQPIALEIHEAAVINPIAMRELKHKLRDLDIDLAYDDFGAGQTRLVELVEVRPDYLKFDISLIQEIDAAPEKRQQMLATLVRMVRELGVVAAAEGVETAKESETCAQMGFELGQGFHYGHPAPAKSLQV